MLLFIIPFIIVTQLSNGSMLHIFANTSPYISFGKYISPVKHTNCTTILDIPDDAFSVNVLPINIPIAINSIATTIDTKIAHIMFILKLNPKIMANIKNNTFWIIIMGIIEII